jgi:hypothetical protein
MRYGAAHVFNDDVFVWFSEAGKGFDLTLKIPSAFVMQQQQMQQKQQKAEFFQ